MKGIITVVSAILIIIILFIGKYMFPNIDGVIQGLVKDINATFVQVKADADIMDARSYRDGKTKGIVLEYRFSKRASERKFDPEEIKKSLIKELKSQGVEDIVELGIFFIVIYKNYKDQEIFKVIISGDDLKS